MLLHKADDTIDNFISYKFKVVFLNAGFLIPNYTLSIIKSYTLKLKIDCGG